MPQHRRILAVLSALALSIAALSEMRYQNMRLALLNAAGCPEFIEEIKGPVSRPQVQKTGIVGSLTGSVTSIVQQGIDILDFRECTPFYQGEVTPATGNQPD